MKVYLSGPITGRNPRAIRSGRKYIETRLSKFAEVVDPAKYHIDNTVAFRNEPAPNEELRRLAHGRLVVERNKRLVSSCDALVADLLDCGERVSIGTVCEISWAFAYSVFIAVIREERFNVHDHAMLNAMASVVCTSRPAAIKVLEQLTTSSRDEHLRTA